jgi:hypothetical protein
LGIFDGGSKPDLSSVAWTPGPVQPLTGGADPDPYAAQSQPDSVGQSDPGSLFGGGSTGPLAFSLDGQPAGWQVALSNTADVVAGAGDAISFGLSAWFRRKMAGQDPRNHCSGYYTVGALAPLAVGGARMAYAGAAKALPLLVRGGATELERALAVSQARNTLKVIARAGLGGTYRLYTAEQILGKYGPDAAKIISKATQTSAPINATGGGLIIGALGTLAGRPGYCQ